MLISHSYSYWACSTDSVIYGYHNSRPVVTFPTPTALPPFGWCQLPCSVTCAQPIWSHSMGEEPVTYWLLVWCYNNPLWPTLSLIIEMLVDLGFVVQRWTTVPFLSCRLQSISARKALLMLGHICNDLPHHWTAYKLSAPKDGWWLCDKEQICSGIHFEVEPVGLGLVLVDERHVIVHPEVIPSRRMMGTRWGYTCDCHLLQFF